jgi:MFS family permease
MEPPEIALRGTIWLSLLAWLLGEWQRSPRRDPVAAGRWAWTLGALAAVVHSALAFHLRYGWSHAAASAETERQTVEVTGLAWGGGIFFNYAFLAVWTVDAVWWWLVPDSYHRRPRPLDRFVRGFLWLMFLNGAVVFAHGQVRWLGAAGVLAVAAAWCRDAGAGKSIPFYYGWVSLGLSALAMVGTLPGRTQGLGLVTEPLLRDLAIDRILFAEINLVATLLGSLFCLGIGRLIDRAGSRIVLTAVTLCLGLVVLLMSGTRGAWSLLVLITLTRGFGQSALSVASLALVGKWFSRRLPLAMGVYAIVMSIGFMAAFPVVGAAVIESGWRAAWAGVGLALVLVLTPLFGLFVRSTPEGCGIPMDGGDPRMETEAPIGGVTLREALRTPAFWVFALASSAYGLVASGIALFNESILAERGFDPAIYHRTLVVVALTGLFGNLAGGAFAERGSLKRLLAVAMLLLTLSLAALPHVSTQGHVMAYAVVMGLAGGFVMVVFFSFWGRAYGRAHLGRIQGAAQILTVLASAVGPLLLAQCVAWTGSYATAFYALAALVAALGGATAVVPMPASGGQEEQ